MGQNQNTTAGFSPSFHLAGLHLGVPIFDPQPYQENPPGARGLRQKDLPIYFPSDRESEVAGSREYASGEIASVGRLHPKSIRMVFGLRTSVGWNSRTREDTNYRLPEGKQLLTLTLTSSRSTSSIVLGLFFNPPISQSTTREDSNTRRH